MNSNNLMKIFTDSPFLEWLVSALALRCIKPVMHNRLHKEDPFMRSQQFFSWSRNSTSFVELFNFHCPFNISNFLDFICRRYHKPDHNVSGAGYAAPLIRGVPIQLDPIERANPNDWTGDFYKFILTYPTGH
jgi:hypothetical protein